MRIGKAVDCRGSQKIAFGHGMLGACLSFILFALIPAAAFSAHDPAIDRGLQWLYAHQNADSSWGGADLVNYRDTKEVLSTLISLKEQNAHYQGGLNWLTQANADNTDFLSRKVVLYVEAGLDASGFLRALVASQAREGGVGYKAGYNSDLWNTILALEAMGLGGFEDQRVLGSALTYVLQRQNPDGGFPIKAGEESKVFPTAVCVLMLNRFPGWIGVPEAIERGMTYLKNQVNPDWGYGEGGSSVYETALVWLCYRTLNREIDLGAGPNNTSLRSSFRTEAGMVRRMRPPWPCGSWGRGRSPTWLSTWTESPSPSGGSWRGIRF